MRNLFALAVLCALPALTQELYTTSREFVLSGQSAAIAVQLPATGSQQAEIVEATVQCLDAVCDVRPEVNGAAAGVGTGATAGTLEAVDPETSDTATISSRLQVWYGTGTAIPTGAAIAPTNGWRIPAAGGILPLGGGRRLSSNGAGNKNYILRIVGSHTGTVRLFIAVRVRR